MVTHYAFFVVNKAYVHILYKDSFYVLDSFFSIDHQIDKQTLPTVGFGNQCRNSDAVVFTFRTGTRIPIRIQFEFPNSGSELEPEFRIEHNSN